MFKNITTNNGSQKPTPRIILALLSVVLLFVWQDKEELIKLLNVSPALSTMVASISTILLVFLADQFGVNLPGSNQTPTDSTPKI